MSTWTVLFVISEWPLPCAVNSLEPQSHSKGLVLLLSGKHSPKGLFLAKYQLSYVRYLDVLGTSTKQNSLGYFKVTHIFISLL